jgi:hypothetical protein
MPELEERDRRLFDFVWGEVGAACGDGDGVVVPHTGNIKEYADKFEKWMRAHEWLSKYPFERHDHEDHVLFCHYQENIIFVKPEAAQKCRVPWKQEIWLEVW